MVRIFLLVHVILSAFYFGVVNADLLGLAEMFLLTYTSGCFVLEGFVPTRLWLGVAFQFKL